MSCDRRCFDEESDWYGHEDCKTCPGHDCSRNGCGVCKPDPPEVTK
jgi:hypothetical protein